MTGSWGHCCRVVLVPLLSVLLWKLVEGLVLSFVFLVRSWLIGPLRRRWYLPLLAGLVVPMAELLVKVREAAVAGTPRSAGKFSRRASCVQRRLGGQAPSSKPSTLVDLYAPGRQLVDVRFA